MINAPFQWGGISSFLSTPRDHKRRPTRLCSVFALVFPYTDYILYDVKQEMHRERTSATGYL